MTATVQGGHFRRLIEKVGRHFTRHKRLKQAVARADKRIRQLEARLAEFVPQTPKRRQVQAVEGKVASISKHLATGLGLTASELDALKRRFDTFSATMSAADARMAGHDAALADLRKAVEQALERASYARHRWYAIDKLLDYLIVAELSGDYHEYGVFEGKTFGYALRSLGQYFPDMTFVAFDSFEGLPTPKGIDAADGYAGGFHEGQFAATEEVFRANVAAEGDIARVKVVKGWFDATLAPDNPQTRSLGKVAVAWIDGDLYGSAVPVLAFLTHRLSVGSVLLFDDWRCFRNLADFGEQRACREWLERNPGLKLNEFFDFGFGGKAFTVAACAPASKDPSLAGL